MSDVRDSRVPWQIRAAEYAHIMSRVKWTPVAEGMPIRGGGCFQKGTEYTGVPYSSVKSVGRYIGFDIFLKTFLAAVENPLSVLYTEDLSGKVTNAAGYYGKVCSSFTSYALQCGIWYVSRVYGPSHRDGVRKVDTQSAQNVEVADIIFTPPKEPSGGSHVEIVTGITRADDGTVTHVLEEESVPPTARTINRSAAEFEAHLAAGGKELYRITDLDTWHGDNRAEVLRFPNYAEDAATPVINRMLLLDRGDWVPYHREQSVKIHVMDRDAQGVKALVIRRGDTVVEKIRVEETGVIERSLPVCGDYTAHCLMADGSRSQACEFAVCHLDFGMPPEMVLGESLEIDFESDNLDVAIVHLNSGVNSYAHHNVFVTDRDRENGKVAIPADFIEAPGTWQVWLIGENRYGRLKKRRDIVVKEKTGER